MKLTACPIVTMAITALMLLVTAPATAAGCNATSSAQRVAVLELYTSEGCDSCPPTDRWVSALPARGFAAARVVTLAYHVDYWNHLGWTDPFAQARFRDSAPEGQRIPGAVEGVASLAIALDNLGPWFGALQLRYFGPRPLTEDNSVRSKASALLNGRIGYKIGPKLRVELEGFNLSNRKVSAIDYHYTSRLPGEATQGVADIHFHPIESRSFRLSLNANF